MSLPQKQILEGGIDRLLSADKVATNWGGQISTVKIYVIAEETDFPGKSVSLVKLSQ